MKKILLFIAILATMTFSSCKKCWDCGEMVDGHAAKTCDKARMEAIEAGQVYTDVNGNPVSRDCK